MGDFFYPSSTNIMTFEDFNSKYSGELKGEDYIELRYIINLALQCFRFPREKLIKAEYPIRPLLAEVAGLAKKGCSPYAKLLSTKYNLKHNMLKRESKWHAELGCTYS